MLSKKFQKIAIIGNAGSGKSTLAQKLHNIHNLPVYHLDQYYWKPNWVKPDPVEYKMVYDNLCDGDKWIIDGQSLKLLEYRIKKADLIIFLDLPRYKCFFNIIKRTWQNYGQGRPDCPKGCVERFNLRYIEFLKYVWNFKKKYPVQIRELLAKYPDKQIYIFKSHRETDFYLKNLI